MTGEIHTHYGALELVRSLLSPYPYDVAVLRQDADGSGAIRVTRTKGRDMNSVVRYTLPCEVGSLAAKVQIIGITEDTGQAWDRTTH